ncbi:hypothetical protein BC830DRAFT_707469 [Chytriomyces sp. MP71]|nr:hypothetical protein BC830DRAFT_707469 [Chytriomyces sp. MP71]
MPKDARPDLASPVLSTILTRLEPALQTEMTRILGPALVAQVTELRFETAVLLEIASEYHAETEMQMFRDEDEDILRSRGTFQWNALNQRIQTLVASLRLKGEEAGLSQHDASVVEYVLVKGQSQQLRAASPSHAHDCPQKLLSILKQIGITFKGGEVGSGELHQIVRELRAAIEEERDALLQDIESLHESLDQERGLRSKVETLATAEAPSLQDLQKVKERLESKWIRAEQRTILLRRPQMWTTRRMHCRPSSRCSTLTRSTATSLLRPMLSASMGSTRMRVWRTHAKRRRNCRRRQLTSRGCNRFRESPVKACR